MNRVPGRMARIACAVACAVGVTTCATSQAATSTPTITTADYRTLAVQQGLGIALASNVLQSQLIADAYLYPNSVDDCRPLEGGGSQNLLSATMQGTPGKTTTITKGTNVIYYGDACTQRYMVQQAVLTTPPGTAPVQTMTTTTTYYAPGGAKLGVMTTRASAQQRDDGTANLDGLATFTVPGAASPVSLGLGCHVTQIDKVLALCQGGISQTFRSLHHALGSVTPIRLEVTRATAPVAVFTGANVVRRVGRPGSLGIRRGAPQKLTLTGAGTSAGSVTVAGRAGSFSSLFPPTPTGWTITDRTHHLTFAIALQKGAARTLTGTLRSRGVVLARLAVDRSGTGTLTYTGKHPTRIVGWVLIG